MSDIVAAWARQARRQAASKAASEATPKAAPKAPSQRRPPPPGPFFAPQSAEDTAKARRRNVLGGLILIAAAGLGYHNGMRKRDSILYAEPHALLSNWSGTHIATARRLYEPSTRQELETVVRLAHTGDQPLRAAGALLSPNGAALSAEAVVSTARLDRVLEIDAERRTVRVQAGARVADVAAALRPHGLTLANYASIREQTVGGFVQAGSHGTGARLPPVDAQVVGLTLVTPAEGTVELTRERDPELLALAGVALGALGVVAELTLACVPAHRLVETTTVERTATVRARHAARVLEAKHLRYMWIPHTDAVVVVRCDELPAGGEAEAVAVDTAPDPDAAAPLVALAVASKVIASTEDAAGMSPFDLRGLLLGRAPLDAAWVKRVNAAEAEYWRRAAGTRVGWSDDILGFDCGGEQWVDEVCFRDGTVAAPGSAAMDYMSDLLKLIQRGALPAHAPIEQRWTCGSPSRLSPAAGAADDLFSWVGIIQYRIPAPGDEADVGAQKPRIDAAFARYRRLVDEKVGRKYDARQHWAKLEPPEDPAELDALRARLARQYPLEEFNALRRRFDPKNILANDWLNALIPRTDVEEAAADEAA